MEGLVPWTSQTKKHSHPIDIPITIRHTLYTVGLETPADAGFRRVV